MSGEWAYPREQICLDCLMIGCSRYDQIRPRKPSKMSDKAELLFPLTVYDTSNNTKVGEFHNKEDVLAAVVDKYKQERKSTAKILVTHLYTYYNFTDYWFTRTR